MTTTATPCIHPTWDLSHDAIMVRVGMPDVAEPPAVSAAPDLPSQLDSPA